MAILWLSAAAGGFAYISHYQSVAGARVTARHAWPSTAISRASDRNTLVMFAHPHCPCTRASLEELNRILARCGAKVAAHVLFVKVAGAPADWTETDLWRSAKALPGVIVHEDVDGSEAAKFGASTSGHVLLYDPRGNLLFEGGITASRGHAGDNAGEGAIVALLNGQPAGVEQTPVYGCALENCPPEIR